jgi:nucleolar protein 14
VALARSRAVNKRRSTLLEEWKASHKANVFADKRIGENKADMSTEEKHFARFKRQQARNVKRRKTTKYALADGDDDGEAFELTHGGKKLEEAQFEEDRFDGFSDDDDDGMAGTRGLDRCSASRFWRWCKTV